MEPTASTAGTAQVTLRAAELEDLEACAQILFDAFGDIHDHHRFPRDFPALEAAMGMLGAWIPHPAVWGVVAEVDGGIVGSNFLDERDPVRGVGPITIAPDAQNAGVGRKLMEAVLERGEGARDIRSSHSLRSRHCAAGASSPTRQRSRSGRLRTAWPSARRTWKHCCSERPRIWTNRSPCLCPCGRACLLGASRMGFGASSP